MKLVKLFDYFEEIAPALGSDIANRILNYFEPYNDTISKYRIGEDFECEEWTLVDNYLLNNGCIFGEEVYFLIYWQKKNN